MTEVKVTVTGEAIDQAIDALRAAETELKRAQLYEPNRQALFRIDKALDKVVVAIASLETGIWR